MMHDVVYSIRFRTMCNTKKKKIFIGAMSEGARDCTATDATVAVTRIFAWGLAFRVSSVQS